MDYVYLQYEAPMTLNVKARPIIFRVKKVLPSVLLLLEGNDGNECRTHFKNYASCHLPIEGTIYHELVVVPKCLPCFVCRARKLTANMLLCDRYKCGWHMACMRSPLSILPSAQ